MNRETLSITPDDTHNASMQEDFSSIDPQLFQAHNQLALQVETLGHDPSLSAEQEKEKEEAIYQAVGALSLATEGLDYDALKQQTEINIYQAYAAEQINQQALKAIYGDEDELPGETRSNKKKRRFQKHRTLFAVH